jgi:hypothetical protein
MTSTLTSHPTSTAPITTAPCVLCKINLPSDPRTLTLLPCEHDQFHLHCYKKYVLEDPLKPCPVCPVCKDSVPWVKFRVEDDVMSAEDVHELFGGQALEADYWGNHAAQRF